MKEAFSAIAIALTLAAYWPYIRAIRRGDTKPHVFSWVIWGVSTVIVFLAQLAGHAGVGAWPVGISGAISLYVAWLAHVHRADSTITRSDWGFFLAAMSSLPLWAITKDPLWAVVILTGVDLMGFGPTFRKAYERPQEEQLLLFYLIGVRCVFVVAALEAYSVTTVLFPASVGVFCVLFIAMVSYRRRVLAVERAG